MSRLKSTVFSAAASGPAAGPGNMPGEVYALQFSEVKVGGPLAA